ncbi:MAG: GTP 3',8-cyclase MoaA [Psychrilyobacter sp.]|nr:GTP 3',8-cyclase MoaA [Psychrilyobacter sp.]
MLDSYKRNIDYLRISITEDCNFRCKYCNPNGELNYSKKSISKDEIIEIVKLFSELGVKKVRLTGGEPLLRSDLIEIIRDIKKIKNIEEITMTTNGLLLNKNLLELKNAGLNRVNLSLDTFNKSKFKEITGVDGLDKVLEVIGELELLEMVPIKINCVLINKFNNDEIKNFINFTRDKKVQIRFIELMSMGDNIEWGKEKYLSAEEVLEKHKDLKLYKEENVAKIYKLPNSKGEVGFISPNSNKFCSSCNRIRITSEGKLKLCLHSDIEYDLLKILKSKNPLTELKNIMLTKPKEHKLGEEKYIKKNMVKIGG